MMNFFYDTNLLLIIFLNILSVILLISMVFYKKYVRENFIINPDISIFYLLDILVIIVLSILFFFPNIL